MKYLIRIVRPINLFIVALTMMVILYRYQVEMNPNYWFEAFLLILATVFNAASGYVVNDIFDVETDAINKPGQNVVGNGLSKKHAWMYYLILSGLSIAISYYYSEQFAVINISIMAILYLYAVTLKGMSLIGNLFVAICSAAVLACCVLQVQFDTLSANYNFLGYVIFAFFISLIREIVKDIQDVDGDKAVGLKTLPISSGIKGAKIMIFSFTGIEILLCGVYSFIVWGIGFYISSVIMGLITVSLFYFLNLIAKSKEKEDFKLASQILKVLMFVGVVNILFS